MKKILLTFLLFFSLGFAASAETYEWTISSSDKSATTAKFNLILNNVTWSATHKSNGSSLHSQREGTEDIVFGSKNNSFNSLTLEAKAPFTNKKIESVSVTAWGGSKANISVSVYVNDVMVGNTQTLASAAATYDFSSVETLGENGTLKIEFTNSNSNNESNNTLKLSGLKVVYSEAQGGDTPDPTPDTPVISAATGDVVYAEGETASNEVVKGTEVTFTVTNCEDADISSDPEMVFVNGKATVKINEDVVYTIMAGEAIEEFHFTVKEETVDPTPDAPVISAATGDVV
ncbi:MAG: hypothetical protein K2F77_00890, partial [Muribaculaceae bacterium]|nr:hypothetical protein [Muribaculaceae bacterium]